MLRRSAPKLSRKCISSSTGEPPQYPVSTLAVPCEYLALHLAASFSQSQLLRRSMHWRCMHARTHARTHPHARAHALRNQFRAQVSRRGLLLFVDEADAFLRKGRWVRPRLVLRPAVLLG
jgi:hypothetical protein